MKTITIAAALLLLTAACGDDVDSTDRPFATEGEDAEDEEIASEAAEEN